MKRRTFIQSALALLAAPSIIAKARPQPTMPDYDPTKECRGECAGCQIPFNELPCRDIYEILTPDDIREHFHYAPTPVFEVNGKKYTVKSRWGEEKIARVELLYGDGKWREEVVPRVIKYVARDEAFYQRQFPGCTMWVNSFRFNSSYMVAPDYSLYHVAIWRSAIVKAS